MSLTAGGWHTILNGFSRISFCVNDSPSYPAPHVDRGLGQLTASSGLGSPLLEALALGTDYRVAAASPSAAIIWSRPSSGDANSAARHFPGAGVVPLALPGHRRCPLSYLLPSAGLALSARRRVRWRSTVKATAWRWKKPAHSVSSRSFRSLRWPSTRSVHPRGVHRRPGEVAVG